MRHAVAAVFLCLGLLVAAPSTAAAQTTVPGVNTPFGGLARTIAGIDIIKAEVAGLRRQLSGCDGPGASRTGACATRALLQAKLNYLLEVSMLLGDPDTAGAPPTPATKPADASDYETELRYLQEQMRKELGGVYLISENRAKFWIILHCKAVKDLTPLTAYMTPEEAKGVGGPKTRAAVSACIAESDAKAIVANRKTAFEYCMQSTLDPNGERRLLNLCMHKHDVLTAMCKQDYEMVEWWARHKTPAKQHAWPQCPLDRLFASTQETQAVMAAPPVRTMPELPPKFFAPPDVVIAPRTPLPIPPGTVIEVRIQGSWDGLAIDMLANNGSIIPTRLDEPLVVGGKEVLAAHSGVIVKGRVIGPGARPDTVRIGLTTDEVNVQPIGSYADLKSNELVFTVPYKSNANNPGIMFDTRMRFTLNTSGAVEMPAAQTPAAPIPAPNAPPPPTAGPGTATPQSPAEDVAKKGERIQACIIKAMKDYPPGTAQAQAMVACGQIK